MQDIVSAHNAILEGIASKNPEQAANAVREHLSSTISRINVIRQEHPAYFAEE
jgi:DNA-binding FadR family transcriptional regulator